ncbi:hypothetical protein [Streptomyces sp. NPDC058045]|uniref:hypothetical protein n=1 Tax=Streptomyces sp. NPDC058045 TaxID=3346311 RepID=UPI0036E2507E
MGEVSDAVRAEISALGVEPTAPGLAAAAVTLAEHLDAARGPTGAANVARELRMVVGELRDLAPMTQEGDALDDLTARREARRRGA